MELLFDIFLIAVFSAFLIMSQDIAEITISNDHLGSAGFPQMIAVVALVLLTAAFAFKVRSLVISRSGGSTGASPVGAKVGISRTFYLRLLAMVLILLAYIVLLKQLGFVLETVLFTYLSLVVLGERKHLRSVLFAVAFTAMLVIVFGRVFFIALPRGIEFLREISYYLY